MDLESLKAARAAAQRKRSKLEKQFLAMLNMAVNGLTTDEERTLVLEILDEDLATRLDDRITRARQAMITRFRIWADKYAVSLDALESARQASRRRLASYLKELGYE